MEFNALKDKMVRFYDEQIYPRVANWGMTAKNMRAELMMKLKDVETRINNLMTVAAEKWRSKS